MKPFLFIICITIVGIIHAQQDTTAEDILIQLKKLNITLTDITLHAQPLPKDLAFEMEVQIPDKQSPVTYLATYDPSKTSNWEMLSWNGKKPDTKECNVLMHRAEGYATMPVLVNLKTLHISQEGKYFVVTFRIDPGTAPKQYSYLKDCDAKAYINASGKLERTVWENFQPTRNQNRKVKSLQEEVYFIYTDGAYHVSREIQYVNENTATLMGYTEGQISQDISYSHYRTVK